MTLHDKFPSLLPLQVDAELRSMETASIKDYIQESDSIAGLYEQVHKRREGCGSASLLSCSRVKNTRAGVHSGVIRSDRSPLSPARTSCQIEACEGVLGQMQALLQGFQDNLGGISTEIRTLQVLRLA
jgi:hypothetical protein